MKKEKKPRVHSNSAARKKPRPAKNGHGAGDREELLREIAILVPDHEIWLNTENTRFMMRKPIDLIGTEDEYRLREMLAQLKYGLYI